MRNNSYWSDCVPTQILWPLIVTISILGFLLVSECSLQPAHAGSPYVTVGGGFTAFNPTTADGDFTQQYFRPNYKWAAPAFKVGAGYAFNDRYAVELRYVNAGSNGYDSKFVSDLSYNAKTHTCTASCNTPGFLRARDYVQGFDLTVLRTFTDYDYRPYVRLGAALMYHRLDVNVAHNPVNVAPDSQSFMRMEGWMPMAVLGVGVKRDRFSLETTFYTGFGGTNCVSPCGFPQSTQFLTTMLGVTFG